jgi:hypothetical protein
VTGAFLAGLTLVLAALMLVPFAAGVLLAACFGVSHRTLLVSFGLGGIGVLGAVTFAAYLLSPTVGRVFAIGATAILAVLAGWAGTRLNREGWLAVRELAAPTGLWTAYSLASVALGCVQERCPRLRQSCIMTAP